MGEVASAHGVRYSERNEAQRSTEARVCTDARENVGHRKVGGQSRKEIRKPKSSQFNIISGCSAVGSAPALGASLAVTAVKKQKSRKAFTYAGFRHFAKSQKSVKIGVDHSLSHFYAKTEKIE